MGGYRHIYVSITMHTFDCCRPGLTLDDCIGLCMFVCVIGISWYFVLYGLWFLVVCVLISLPWLYVNSALSCCALGYTYKGQVSCVEVLLQSPCVRPCRMNSSVYESTLSLVHPSTYRGGTQLITEHPKVRCKSINN